MVLGGGRNGYLGPGLTAAKHVSVLQTACIRPVYPGPIATGGTMYHDKSLSSGMIDQLTSVIMLVNIILG